jgi:hypothetical protein
MNKWSGTTCPWCGRTLPYSDAPPVRDTGFIRCPTGHLFPYVNPTPAERAGYVLICTVCDMPYRDHGKGRRFTCF